jgi:hypothetical protein
VIPVDLIKALHASARRYCEQRIKIWSSRYQELKAEGEATVPVGDATQEEAYTEAALSTFPRTRVMSSILREVEHLQPNDFDSVPQARRVLELLAESTRSSFEQPFCQDIELQAVNEECALFAHYVETLTTTELTAAHPLG